jgi:hypothetical protein
VTIPRSVVLSLLCFAPVVQGAVVAPFVGSFGFHMGSTGNSSDTVIACESEQKCRILTIIDYEGKRTTSTNQVTKITAADITAPQGALDYAIGQRSAVITNKDYVDAMNLLRPVLSRRPKVSRCWDLNWPTPAYTLLCTFSGDGATPPIVYAFFELAANCRQAFCGYVIFPLARRTSLPPSSPTSLPTQPPAASASQRPASDADPYVTAFDNRVATVHSTGRWYFELAIDREKVVDIYPTEVLFGVSDKERFTGTSEKVTAERNNLRTVEIGIAVDLDNSKLYVRRDGIWMTGMPGSNRGSDLKSGRNYYAALMVASKPHYQEYLDRGAIIPNYGGIQPTAFLAPPGYLVWREPPPMQSLECSAPAQSRYKTRLEEGQRDAQLAIGLQKYYGTCAEAKDLEGGLALMQKSALQGYPPALFALARAYQFSSRPMDAAKMYEAAARQGYRQAEFELASLSESGEPPVRDHVTAYAWYSLAASRRDPAVVLTASYYEVAALRSSLTPQELARAEALKATLLRELGSLPPFREPPIGWADRKIPNSPAPPRSEAAIYACVGQAAKTLPLQGLGKVEAGSRAFLACKSTIEDFVATCNSSKMPSPSGGMMDSAETARFCQMKTQSISSGARDFGGRIAERVNVIPATQ